MENINLNSVVFNEIITKEDILTHITQEEIFGFYMGEDISSLGVYHSPLREDNIPSFALYFHKHNPHWKEEYELVTSNSGFERHLIPVSELTIVKDLNTKSSKKETEKENPFFLPDPDDINDTTKLLQRIATALESIAKSINK